MGDKIMVGVANDGSIIVDTDTIREWEPKKISYMGTTVFFQVEDTFHSMKRSDFEEIFK